MVRPTRLLVLLAATGLVVALLPTIVDIRLWPVWPALLLGLALAFVADLVLAVPRRRLEVRVETPALLSIGRPGALAIHLSAPRWVRATRVHALADLAPEFERQPQATGSLPGGGETTVEIPLVARRRGRHGVVAVWLRWTGPFGLAERWAHRPLPDTYVRVTPDVAAVRTVALRFFGSRDFRRGLKIERYVGEGTEFDCLREYVPGLDSRWIDWKASARHTKLVCRDHRAERNHQVYLAFDTGHLMGEPAGTIPKLDHAINAGLLLAYVCLRTGDRVGLHAFDATVRQFHAPRAGVATFHRLQAHAADLDYGHDETNFTVGLTDLLARLTRRSLVVLFTDFVDTVTADLMLDNLRRLARKHVVVFVALRDATLDAAAAVEPRSLTALGRAVTAGDLIRERDTVIERLRRMGVSVIDARPQDVHTNLINRYLDVKRRELV